jgi:hypothetical protein
MLTRYLQQMLFDVTPLDPAVFIAMPVVLAAVLAAALLSARPALTGGGGHGCLQCPTQNSLYCAGCLQISPGQQS